MDRMRSLKCGEVESDAKALREKYASNPVIMESLKTNWVKVIQRLPVRIAVPPDAGTDTPRPLDEVIK